MVRVLIPLVLTGIMVFAIVDIIVIDSSRVRHLPKPFWIVVTIALPLIGPILWFLLGREPSERREHGRMPSAPRQTTRGPVAPDDDPEFLRRLDRERAQEERIRDLERRLAELDDDDPKS